MLFEGFSFWDAIYMTVITISTVGYREVKLTLTGRIIAMILIILGVGLVFYTFGAVLEYFFGDFFESTLKQRRALARMRKMKDHYIVCGYGRVGKIICQELKNQGKEFVVIEMDAERFQEAEEEGILPIHGNATDEKILL